MYTVIALARDMALGDMVYLSRHCKIVSLNVAPDPFTRNKNQGYNTCIHDIWAVIKDTCYTRHHRII